MRQDRHGWWFRWSESSLASMLRSLPSVQNGYRISSSGIVLTLGGSTKSFAAGELSLKVNRWIWKTLCDIVTSAAQVRDELTH